MRSLFRNKSKNSIYKKVGRKENSLSRQSENNKLWFTSFGKIN